MNIAGTTDSNGLVDITLPTANTGTIPINVTFIETDDYNSKTITTTIDTKIDTTITITPVKTNAINTTIKVTVNAESGTVNNGTINVYDDNGIIIASAEVADGSAVVAFSPRFVGQKNYTFTYSGNTIYNPSNTTEPLDIVIAGTNIKVQVLKNNLVNLTFDITVRTGNILVEYGTIQIYEDNVLLKEVSITDGRLTVQVLPTSTGTHKYRIVYLNNDLYNKNSWIDDVNIIKAGTNIKVETLKTNAANTTFKVTVKSGEYHYVQTGYVNVYLNGEIVGQAYVENGIATITVTPNKTGNLNYTIRYIGDKAYDSSASQNKVVSTTQAGTNIALETLSATAANTKVKVTVKTANTP